MCVLPYRWSLDLGASRRAMVAFDMFTIRLLQMRTRLKTPSDMLYDEILKNSWRLPSKRNCKVHCPCGQNWKEFMGILGKELRRYLVWEFQQNIFAVTNMRVCNPWGLVEPLRASSHGSKVPCPTCVSKSQHGGKVPTCEPQEPLKYSWLSLKSNLDFFIYKICRTWVESWD